jgi:hypothetical protein
MGVIINSESSKGIPKEAKPLGFSFSFFFKLLHPPLVNGESVRW